MPAPSAVPEKGRTALTLNKRMVAMVEVLCETLPLRPRLVGCRGHPGHEAQIYSQHVAPVLSALPRLNYVKNTFCIAFHCFLLVKDRN